MKTLAQIVMERADEQMGSLTPNDFPDRLVPRCCAPGCKKRLYTRNATGYCTYHRRLKARGFSEDEIQAMALHGLRGDGDAGAVAPSGPEPVDEGSKRKAG